MLGFIAKEFNISPDELFHLTQARYNFYVQWMAWNNTRNTPVGEEIITDADEFAKLFDENGKLRGG